PRDHVHRGGPALVRGRDVEEGQLVGALDVVGGGQLDGGTGVAELLEVDALDHPATVDVEARDHAHGERHRAPLVSASASASENLPSYRAVPAMAPSTPSGTSSMSALMSSRVVTPPEATTGRSVAAHTSRR